MRSLRTRVSVIYFFFFNDTATTEIYTLSLHDALPILVIAIATEFSVILAARYHEEREAGESVGEALRRSYARDRKSTRLNSSHANISYAVFCLKKKKQTTEHIILAKMHTISTRVRDSI